MACNLVKYSDGRTAIICGLPRYKLQKCQFCGAPGTKLCDWKTDKPVEVSHLRLRADDTVVTARQKHRLRIQGFQRLEVDARVALGLAEQALLDQPHSDQPCVTVTMYGLAFPDGRCWLYYCWSHNRNATVTVLRPGTCDAPCCELHSRSVGEDVDYCMTHWRSWEVA